MSRGSRARCSTCSASIKPRSVSPERRAATPDVVTAPFCCYRLRKSDYGTADLQQIEKQLTAKATRGDVFAYIKHEDSPKGALQASALLTRLRAK